MRGTKRTPLRSSRVFVMRVVPCATLVTILGGLHHELCLPKTPSAAEVCRIADTDQRMPTTSSRYSGPAVICRGTQADRLEEFDANQRSRFRPVRADPASIC